MKLEIPGQLRGSDAGRVMPVAIRLRKEYEDQFKQLEDDRITRISPALRVGGKLGSFGDDAIENIRIEDGEAECDLVLAPRNWSSMDEDEIYALLKPKIIKALVSLLNEAGFEQIPRFLA